MKRSREDFSINSTIRRPMASSRPEQRSEQLQITSGSSSSKLTTNDALAYLKNVKKIFGDESTKYHNFLEVMKAFKAQKIQTAGVIARVKDLFKGHRDLILGFNTFLPSGYHISISYEDDPAKRQAVEFEDAISYVNKIKTRFQGDERSYKAFLDVLNKYRLENKPIDEVYEEVSVLFFDHPDLLSEFSNFLPVSPAPKNSVLRRDGNPSLHGTRHLHIDKTDGDRSVDRLDGDTKQRGERDREYKEREHEDRDFDTNGKRLVSRRFEESGGEQFSKGAGHGEDFGSHLGPSGYGMYNQEFTFCAKVKERFGNSDSYDEFVKFLEVYGRENFSRSEFENQVSNLFGRHQDLVEGFIDIFPRTGIIDGFLAALRKKSSRLVKLEDRDRQKDRGLPYGTSNGSNQRMSLYANKDKYIAKPIHELDLSDCEQCTPSYRLLPKDYPIPSASQKTEIGAAVLNDFWVSVTSGSEDYSFKHMRKNQYEEALFRCEDDRFELDMLIENVNVASKRVEDLLNKITANTVAVDNTFHITDHLTALNLRCIERIYGDHGLDVMDVLKKNAPIALPVILTRLKQKQEDWIKCRADFNKVWAEVYAKNHHKSLDHRSFYFKQQDLKNLSTKALTAEIQELREKKILNDDGLLFAMTVGNRPPVIPEMEFVYPDPAIHDDVYKLIKYSCGELSSGEQLDKVLNIWLNFLEPMLGAPRRAQETDDTEDVMASNTLISLELNASRNENGQIGVEVDTPGLGNGDESSRISRRETSNGNITNGENSSGLTAVSTRQGIAGGLVGAEMRQSGENVLSSENGEGRSASINAVTVQITNRLGQAEREEGELSPNGDFGEDNFAAYGNGDVAAAQVPNGENDADDEGEGSGENASENGDVTGSESNDGENGSHEEGDENENKVVESEGEAEVVGNGHVIEGNGMTLPTSLPHLETAKPLRKRVDQALKLRDKDSRIFYGNDAIYALFRLHQVLYDRIHTAKVSISERRWRGSDDSNPTDLYARFLSAVYNLLDGTFDNTKFEDECRAIIGTQSYILFTLDKLIFRIVKQLQAIVTDEPENKLFLLYAYEKSRKPESFDDATYHENVSVLLQDENIYRIECFSTPTRMSLQLMENAHEKHEGVSLDPKFVDYIYNDYLSFIPEHKLTSGLFLNRNKRKYPGEDQESGALEEVQLVNGIEIRISPTSHKGQYVLGTEDVLFRPRKKKTIVHRNGFSHGQANSSKKLTRSQQFNLWLSGP